MRCSFGLALITAARNLASATPLLVRTAEGGQTRSTVAAFNARRFVEQHGVVLASGTGPVPSLAEAVAGEPIRGSWWAHPAGKRIFAALESLAGCPDVLCFRLVQGKLTFVHRRLWPALVRSAERLGPERLAAIRQVHTQAGNHENEITAFPGWVPAEVLRAAKALDEVEAMEALGPWAAKPARSPRSKR